MCDSHVIYVDTYCTSVDRKAPSQYHFCMHDLYTTREGETQQQERSIWVKTAVVVGSFRKGSDWIRPLIHTPPAVWGFHFCFSSAAILERDAHSSSHCPPSSMENWSRAIYGMSGPISMFSNSFFFLLCSPTLLSRIFLIQSGWSYQIPHAVCQWCCQSEPGTD